MLPEVGILPILLVPSSVYQRLPSGPCVMPRGALPVGSAYSVIAPEVVILPILLVPSSVYQRFPSGPCVMSRDSFPSGSGVFGDGARGRDLADLAGP